MRLAQSALPCFAAALFSSALLAQPAPAPPLVGCDAPVANGVEILCGVRAPEDIEMTPDGKALLTTQFVNLRNAGSSAGIALFDLEKKSYRELAVTAAPDKAWGDPKCPGPIGAQLASHGSSLVRRANGAWQYFVTNHGGRQSVEMFELKKGPGKDGEWGLIWHGCVVTEKDYNDVAALADGGFVATHPTALEQPGAPAGSLFDGHASGYLTRWTPGNGEVELPGTRTGYPNGVVATPDGRTLYYAAWTAKEVHKYDTRTGKDVQVAKLDFMPDNLTWTGGAAWSAKAQLIAAGIKGAGPGVNCGALPCNIQFGVAQLVPADLKVTKTYLADRPLISGVSVGYLVKDSVYVGAFQGDRLVRVDWK